jgi:Fic family protein
VDAAWTSSHPFINFNFTTSGLVASTWLTIGEAMSKCEHLAGVPLKPKVAEDLSAVYLARGVQATTAIEGNTLSDDEVLNIVRRGSAGVSESRAYLEREVKNILMAVRDIDDALSKRVRPPLTVERIYDLNRQVLDGIPDEPWVVPGAPRRVDVVAGPYKAPHWSHVPDLLDHFVKWLAEMRSPVGSGASRADRFTTALLTAILAHVYIAWIHPFGNGNGRTARLLEVQILSESGVVPIVATNLLSDHYHKTRSAYYLALNAAQRDISEFIRYAINGFIDELRDQIGRVRTENLEVHWESYVYELFRDRPSTEAQARQREVALRLPPDRPVTPEEMTNLSPALARRYATCGVRTPARDLNDLAKMGLVERPTKRKYRARREIIEAFIPPVAL